jgi:long-chain acyl-CoA synthetase
MNAKTWLKSYDPGVSSTVGPYPGRTLLDYFADTVKQRPDQPMVLFKGTRLTYAEIARLSDAFAAALVELGVKRGDRLALILPNCPQFMIAELGAWKAGAIVVPLNPIYTEHELIGPLSDTGAETILTLTPFYARVKAIQSRTSLKRVIATNIKEYLPPVLRLLFTLVKEKKEGHRVTLQPGDLWLSDLLKAQARAPRPNVAVGPDDPAVILMSGGTTGNPKGVIGLHRNYEATGLQLHAWLKPVANDWQDVFMVPLPLFHSFANVGVQSASLIGRYTLALIPNPRDLSDVLHTLGKVRPTYFSGVPTLFNALMNHPDVKAGKVDFSSVKIWISGAAALMAETKKRFEETTGGQIVEGYSLTEAMIAAALNPVRGAKKIGSVGIPVPDVEMRIADAETGEGSLPAGEVGEILIRAPQLMTGYWQNPDETAQVLQSHGEGGPWLHTGDLGYMDEDGYIFIVDRKKDLIKISGYQVWPREIEEVIATHPAVAEVGVAGVPDATKGEIAKAWVVLRSDASATESEIRAFCREKLAPYKVPAQVEFRKELPKSMVGKVLRRMLVAEQKGGAL